MDTNTLAVAQAAVAALSANTASNLNTVVIALIGFFGLIVTTGGTILLAKINSNAKHAFVQSTANAATLLQVHDVTRRVYTMVNKPFGVALEGAATAMEALAKLPGASEEHRQAASTARQVSDEHAKAMIDYEMSERIHAALVSAKPPEK